MSQLTSIVVVTHERPQFLADCLASCEQQIDVPKEFVVVVNPADDASESIAARHNAKVIRTHRNLGFFPALNIGVANASGNRVMVIDDDAKFEQSDALSRMNAHLDRDAECAVVTCNIHGPCEGAAYPSTCRVPLFKTGFALFRREVFADLAGYVPDTFFRAGGEMYLCNYLYERGRHVTVLADVWMHHAQTATGRSSQTMNFYALRNHALIAVLQEPTVVVPASLLAKVFSSAWRIAIQRGDYAAWLTGWFSVLGNLGWALKHRNAISWSTYRDLRRLRRNTGRAERAIVRQSAEGGMPEPQLSNPEDDPDRALANDAPRRMIRSAIVGSHDD